MRVRFTVKLNPIAPLTKEQSRKGLSGAQSDSKPESEVELRLELQLESKVAARVVLQLQKKEASKSELSEALGYKSISGSLNKQVNQLLWKKLIERTLPDKPNSRLQKYRLTQTGLNILTNL